jgi:hypothetical protein
MSKNYLNPYRGKMEPQQIADGMNAAAKNARSLLTDAELLRLQHSLLTPERNGGPPLCERPGRMLCRGMFQHPKYFKSDHL